MFWTSYNYKTHTIVAIVDHKQSCIFDDLNKNLCLFWKKKWRIITSKFYCQRILSLIHDKIKSCCRDMLVLMKNKLNSYAFRAVSHAKRRQKAHCSSYNEEIRRTRHTTHTLISIFSRFEPNWNRMELNEELHTRETRRHQIELWSSAWSREESVKFNRTTSVGRVDWFIAW